MSDTSYTVRRYRPEDREQVYALYDAVHGQAMGDKCRTHWVWEYERNPYVRDHAFIWAAEADGRVVGVHPSIPIMLYARGERRRALWSVDLMTHPDWRGRGIFKALTERLLEESREEGITAYLVIPNRNSGPLLRKRGWFDIKTFPVMVKPLRVGPILKKLSWRSLPKAFSGAFRYARGAFGPRVPGAASTDADVRITVATVFDDRFDALFEAVATEYDFMTVRDAEYLNWRYAQCPDQKHMVFAAERDNALQGFIAVATGVQNGIPTGYIVDFLARPGPHREAVLRALAGRALTCFKERRAAAAEVVALPEPYRGVLASCGFAEVPAGRFWSYDLVGHIDPADPLAADFKNPSSRWYLSRSDGDSDIASG